MSDVSNTVSNAILEIVRLRVPDASEIKLEHELVRDLALGSLDLAELSATIEVQLKQSIFDDVSMQGFLTVGELVEFCEQASATTKSV